jgi:hypothetical protein
MLTKRRFTQGAVALPQADLDNGSNTDAAAMYTTSPWRGRPGTIRKMLEG